jgi:hypothetical protein
MRQQWPISVNLNNERYVFDKSSGSEMLVVNRGSRPSNAERWAWAARIEILARTPTGESSPPSPDTVAVQRWGERYVGPVI